MDRSVNGSIPFFAARVEDRLLIMSTYTVKAHTFKVQVTERDGMPLIKVSDLGFVFY